MGGKRQRSVIGKLSELLVSGGRAGFLEATISPRSPLDTKIHSPRCIKNYDQGGGGVGLGIVAALEKSSDSDREILGKCCVRCPSKTPSIDPIIPANKNCGEIKGSFEDLEMDDSEDYTYVMCRGPNKSFTMVYYDGGNESRVSVDSKIVHGVITNNPILTIEEDEEEGASVFPTLEYWNSCHLCGKELHGEDIYMYREKAFCSMDCRSKQITKEERKEACKSEAAPRTAPSNVLESAYAERKSFPTGILAA